VNQGKEKKNPRTNLKNGDRRGGDNRINRSRNISEANKAAGIKAGAGGAVEMVIGKDGRARPVRPNARVARVDRVEREQIGDESEELNTETNHTKSATNHSTGRGHSTKLVRLHKYLAECGVSSRRGAEDLISNGEVYVNGELIMTQGTKITPGRDEVKIKNRIIRPVEKGMLLFYKPKHVVTTLDDPEGRPTVADYLTVKYRSYYPVGRLDFDSTGLVLLTNDGDFAQCLMHPKFQYERVYEIVVDGDLPYSVVQEVARGVALEDGPVKGRLLIKSQGGARTTRCIITISEGRNRVIRRLFDHLEFPVLELHRIQHGPFKLGKMRPGQVIKVLESEYQAARRFALRQSEARH